MAAHLLVALLVVFGVNLMPAFGPPTWAVLPAPALVVGGAAAAAAGRLVLALAFRAFGSKLPRKRQESLRILGHTTACAGSSTRACSRPRRSPRRSSPSDSSSPWSSSTGRR